MNANHEEDLKEDLATKKLRCPLQSEIIMHASEIQDVTEEVILNKKSISKIVCYTSFATDENLIYASDMLSLAIVKKNPVVIRLVDFASAPHFVFDDLFNAFTKQFECFGKNDQLRAVEIAMSYWEISPGKNPSGLYDNMERLCELFSKLPMFEKLVISHAPGPKCESYTKGIDSISMIKNLKVLDMSHACFKSDNLPCVFLEQLETFSINNATISLKHLSQLSDFVEKTKTLTKLNISYLTFLLKEEPRDALEATWEILISSLEKNQTLKTLRCDLIMIPFNTSQKIFQTLLKNKIRKLFIHQLAELSDAFKDLKTLLLLRDDVVRIEVTHCRPFQNDRIANRSVLEDIRKILFQNSSVEYVFVVPFHEGIPGEHGEYATVVQNIFTRNRYNRLQREFSLFYKLMTSLRVTDYSIDELVSHRQKRLRN